VTRLIVEEGGARRGFKVGDGVLTVGAGAEAGLRLQSADVADVHAELGVEDGRVTLRPCPGVVPPTVGGVPVPCLTQLVLARNLSVAVTLKFTAVPDCEVLLTVMSAGTVMTGAMVSITVTFCVAVAWLPPKSVAVQVTIVVPSGKPPAGASFVITGSPPASLAVASPSGTMVNGPSPVASNARMSAGAVMTGGVESTMTIVNEPCTELTPPELFGPSSLAVQVTRVLPIGNRLPLAGAWTDWRDMPAPTGKTFMQQWQEQKR